MIDPRRGWPWAVTAAAACFLLCAAVSYWQAGREPRPLEGRGIEIVSAEFTRSAVQPARRYASLYSGRIFFGPAPAASGQVPVAGDYRSALMLRGIIRNDRQAMAVLARAGSKPEDQTWTVRVGDVVLGETVLAIGEDTVTMGKDGQKSVLGMG